MKVLVISDTHGRINNLERVLERVKPLDLLLHLGDIGDDKREIQRLADCRVIAVAGNNDWLSRDPKEQLFPLGNHMVWMVHGHRHSVYYGTGNLYEAAKRNGADIVFYGHTHIPKIDLSGDIWMINPGSLSCPRSGSRCSYVVLDVDAAGEVHVTQKDV